MCKLRKYDALTCTIRSYWFIYSFVNLVLPEQNIYTVRSGESITLKCTIKGGSERTTILGNWMKRSNTTDNRPLELEDTRTEWNKRNNIFTACLTIRNAGMSDTGSYYYSVLSTKSRYIKLNVIRCKFYFNLFFFRIHD